MSQSTKFKLEITAEDKASRPLYQAYQKLQREGKALSNADRQRQMLGIRSERQIQAEILRTQRAYQQLARSGKASSRELLRAKDAELAKIRSLNQELGRGEQLSRGQRVVNGIGKAGTAVAGAYAVGKMATSLVMDPINKRMDYDKSVRGLTKTAFSGRDKEGLQQGQQEIDRMIREYTGKYKATIEEVSMALDGAATAGIDYEDIDSILPAILKASIGTNSSPYDIAKMTKSMLDNGIKPEDIGKNLNYAAASGSEGSFELADMAEAFPKLLSTYMASGATPDQLPQMLGLIQVLTQTSGNTAEAVTQFNALFNEIGREGFGNRISEIDYTDPKTGKKKSIDWEGTRLKGANEVKSTVEVLLSTMEDIMEADPKLKQYKEQLSSKDATQQQQAMMNILESGVISKLFTNDMSKRAMVGLLQQRELYKNQVTDVVKSNDIVENNYQFEADTPERNKLDAETQIELARNDAMKGLTDGFGELSGVIAKYAKEYPELTSQLMLFGEALKVVLGALAAYGITKSLGDFMGGRRNPAGRNPTNTKTSNTLKTNTKPGSKPPGKGGKGGRLGWNPLAIAGAMILNTSGDSRVSDEQKAVREQQEKNYEDRHKDFVDEYTQIHGEDYVNSLVERSMTFIGKKPKEYSIRHKVMAIKKQEVIDGLLSEGFTEEELERGNNAYGSKWFGGNWQNKDPGKLRQWANKIRESEGLEPINENINPSGMSPTAPLNQEIDTILQDNITAIYQSLEAISNSQPKEIVVTIPVNIDGRTVYESVERHAIFQMSRGAV